MMKQETKKWTKELDSRSAIVYRWIGEGEIDLSPVGSQVFVTANEITTLPGVGFPGAPRRQFVEKGARSSGEKSQ